MTNGSTSHKLMSEDGAWERMFNELKQKGYIEERDGAQWFLATKFGAEKDVVVIRSDVETPFSTPTSRPTSPTTSTNWDRNHPTATSPEPSTSGAVTTTDTSSASPPLCRPLTSTLLASRSRQSRSSTSKLDNKKLKLSKRKGQIVTIDDLLDQVGIDVCRYEFLNRSHNAQMTFDIEQAKRQSHRKPGLLHTVRPRTALLHPGDCCSTGRLGPLCRVLT